MHRAVQKLLTPPLAETKTGMDTIRERAYMNTYRATNSPEVSRYAPTTWLDRRGPCRWL